MIADVVAAIGVLAVCGATAATIAILTSCAAAARWLAGGFAGARAKRPA